MSRIGIVRRIDSPVSCQSLDRKHRPVLSGSLVFGQPLRRGGLILGILNGFQIGDRNQRHDRLARSGQDNALLACLGQSDCVSESSRRGFCR